MEIRWEILYVILGGGLLTWLTRVSPLVMLKHFHLPSWAQRFLSYVPISVMSALLTQEVLLPDGKLQLNPFENHGIIGIIPALLVAYWTKSLIGTVVTGVVCMMLLNWGPGPYMGH